MSNRPDNPSGVEEYQGTIVLPGEQEHRRVSLLLNAEKKAVSLRFASPVAEAAEWTGSAVRVTPRLKYTEVTFMTTGLPKEAVPLAWRFNASRQDNTLAGIIVAKPNEQRVTGERGFTLAKPVRA